MNDGISPTVQNVGYGAFGAVRYDTMPVTETSEQQGVRLVSFWCADVGELCLSSLPLGLGHVRFAQRW